MKIEYQDRIENYLLNRMSDADKHAFERDLEKDAELRDQYEFVSMVKTALMLENIEKDVSRWSNAYKERIENDVKEREEQKKVASYRPTGTDCYCPAPPTEHRPIMSHSSGRKILYWISGIAAVFIVGIFIFNNLLSPLPGTSPVIDLESASQPDYSAKNNSDVSFKGSRQMDIERQLAMGDYSKALAQIEELEANIRMELMPFEHELYSRGESQEYEYEQVLLENKLSELLIRKAQVLIELNRTDEAIIILNEIRHYDNIHKKYKEQADSLYNILKKRR